jgi:hypothetical protein
MTLEKPPWGKPVKRNLLWSLIRNYYSREYKKTTAKLISSLVAKSSLKTSQLSLKCVPFPLGFAPFSFAALYLEVCALFNECTLHLLLELPWKPCSYPSSAPCSTSVPLFLLVRPPSQSALLSSPSPHFSSSLHLSCK